MPVMDNGVLILSFPSIVVLRANAQKNRAKSENRGHSSKPNLPSFFSL